MSLKYWMKNQSRQENLIYLVAWGMLFAAPLLSLYVRRVNDPGIAFDFKEVLIVWQRFAIYLAAFLIHNFLLAPLLVYQHRRLLYSSLAGAILTVFIIFQCTHRPVEMRGPGHVPPPEELQGEQSGENGYAENYEGEEKRPSFEDFKSTEAMPPNSGIHPNHSDPMARNGFRKDEMGPPPPEFRKGTPPPFIGEHDILAIVVLILMFGANLGLKLYFRSRNDQKKFMELEKQNLSQQLEYLKYQINPHFFMNTLNNIHALVDIDPAKAQETILELSKMMRFILYEGDKRGVPLSREFDFIRTYIKLMQLRYTDKVKITVHLPAEVPDKTIPPLMLISFIENAFKHGVSYQAESFIEIKVDIIDEKSRAEINDKQLRFHCRNSKAETPNQEKGGVGLANVKQRLNLLYDDNYTLNILDNPDIYDVELIIPLS